MKWLQLCVLISVVSFICNGWAATDNEYTEAKTTVAISPKNREFVIKLRSNPTTGYSWFLSAYDEHLIQPMKHSFVASDSKIMGAPSYEVWTFKAKPQAFSVPQQSKIVLVYARAWSNSGAVSQINFQVLTRSDNQ